MAEVMSACLDAMNRVASADCPVHGIVCKSSSLHPDTLLVFPQHKRVVIRHSVNAAGVRELRLYYGEKEILFDDSTLFGFAEALGQQSRFAAGIATTWGTGYDWPHVRELLEQLLDENILRHASDDHQTAACYQGPLPSPLAPAPSATPRTWFECETIIGELTGHPLEVGYLELAVPVYRVAHMALDAEGRQVGEANVFPMQLRLDVPTDWRTCHYPGSRFQHQQPMNISSLKSMIKHWKPAMALLLRVRNAYLERFPHARDGWTVGDLQRLSALVLSLPAYLLMRRRVDNGHLHPVFSSMYRVTDGVRMTMHRMLLTSINEPSLAPDAPMTSAEIYAYADSNHVFIAEDGVCAGPKAMIEEFLQVLVDGKPIKDAASVTLDPSVQAALDELTPALDYGLLGLQSYAVVLSRWPVMARTYERLLTLMEPWAPGALPAWRERLRRNVVFLRTATRQHNEERRAIHERMHADLYAHCTRALNEVTAPATLADCIAPAREVQHGAARQAVRAVLQRRCQVDVDAMAQAQVAEELIDYLRTEQAIVRAASGIQTRINDLLERGQPKRALSAADVALHHVLIGLNNRTQSLAQIGGRLPNLIDELEADLGLRITVDAAAISIQDTSAEQRMYG